MIWIRAWFIAAATQCNDHYTITALKLVSEEILYRSTHFCENKLWRSFSARSAVSCKSMVGISLASTFALCSCVFISKHARIVPILEISLPLSIIAFFYV